MFMSEGLSGTLLWILQVQGPQAELLDHMATLSDKDPSPHTNPHPLPFLLSREQLLFVSGHELPLGLDLHFPSDR